MQTIEQAEAHAKYIGFRSQEKKDEKAGFFGKDEDKFADFKGFLKRVEKNPALQHSKSIKIQKLIFSLKQVDYDAYKRSGKDYKDLIRETLKRYEEKNDVKLDWIASIHDAEGHPHVHVMIKGVSDVKDKDGRYRRIVFNKADFNDMKANFDRQFEEEADYYEFERYDIKTMYNEVGKGFEMVMNGIKRENERQISEGEFKKQQDIRKAQFRAKQAAKERERDR